MNLLILCFRKIVDLQCFAAVITLLIIFSISAACRLGNYLPASNSSNVNGLTINANESAANRTNPASSNNAVQEGFCQNTYNPIGADVERKYRVTYPNGGLPPRDYTESFKNMTDDSFTVHLQFTDVQVDNNWRCTKDGLLATQFNDNSVKTNSGMNAKIETTRSEGITLPLEARWVTGEKWNTDYDVKETINMPNSAIRGEGNGNVKLSGEIVGEEKITVPAGTFQAMKLRIVQNINITVKINGATMPMPQIPFETTAWYAKNVGMVKSVSTSNGSTVGTTELLSTSER